MSNVTGVPPQGQTVPFYAKAFYEALLEHSTTEQVADGNGTLPVAVFRGKLMEVYASLGLHNNHYTSIRRLLLESGSIEYLTRGTKAYDSVVVLHHPPPDDFTFEGLTTRSPGDILLERAGELDQLALDVEQLSNWHTSLGGLNIVEAFKELERRISQLEKRLNATSTQK